MILITFSEIEEILNVVTRESFRSDGTPWHFDYRKSIVYAQYKNFNEFLQKIINKKGIHKTIILLSTEKEIARQITVRTATKKLFFSETVLLFHPEYGLILRGKT